MAVTRLLSSRPRKVLANVTRAVVPAATRCLHASGGLARSAGPVTLQSAFRTTTCGDVSALRVGETVKLAGWVQAVRDFGPIVFIALRDSYGTVQVKVQAGALSDTHWRLAKSLRIESVVRVSGPVVKRPPELANPAMRSGDVEVEASDLAMLSPVTLGQLPFAVPGAHAAAAPPGCRGGAQAAAGVAAEDVRLTHRYLDLRGGPLQRALRVRSAVSMAMRAFLHGCDPPFVEVETPTLFRSTPEGAREFLVPTRLGPGARCYALAQSPQQYKQLLMVGGCDRYFQFARCYRDESGRADRQPEFTQVDLEMSFETQDGIMAAVEGLISTAFEAAGALAAGIGGQRAPAPLPTAAAASERDAPSGGLPVSTRELLSRHDHLSHSAAAVPLVPRAAPSLPLPRITFTHALSVYGSDKPDRRIGMRIAEAAPALVAALRDASSAPAPFASRLLDIASVASAQSAAASPAATTGSDFVTGSTYDPAFTDLSLFLPGRATVRAFAVPCLGAPGVLSRKQLDALVADICSVSGAEPGKGDVPLGEANAAAAALPAKPLLHVVRVGSGGAFVGHKLATTLPICCQVVASNVAGAVEGDLLVLVAGAGLRAYTAAGAARLVAGEAARRKGFALLPSSDGGGNVACLRPGEAVLVGGQLDAGYSRLSAPEVSALVAKRRETAGSALSPVSDTLPSPPAATAARVDLYWVVEFPLFELDAGSRGFASVHHPFTAPFGPTVLSDDESSGKDDDAQRLLSWLRRVAAESESSTAIASSASSSALLTLRGQHYDLVCNGVELGGGSVRIHDPALQAAVLERVLAVSSEQMSGFSALLTALASGAPPHGGFALGFDRLVATLIGAASIRDVIAFPKSAQGNELMTGAPARVPRAALAELHLQELSADSRDGTGAVGV